MSGTLGEALFRFGGLIAIAILTLVLMFSGADHIWWLFITVSVIFGIAFLGVIFLCLYATAERNR